MLELHRIADHTVVLDVVVGLGHGDGAGVVRSVAAAVGVVVGGDDIQRALAIGEISAGQGVRGGRRIRIADEACGRIIGSGRAVLLDNVVGAVGRGEGNAIVVGRGGVVGRDRLGRQRIEGRRDGDHRNVQGDGNRLARRGRDRCGDRSLAAATVRSGRINRSDISGNAAGKCTETANINTTGHVRAVDRGDFAIVGAVAIAAAQSLVGRFDQVAVGVADRIAVVHLTGQVGRKRAGINNNILGIGLAVVFSSRSERCGAIAGDCNCTGRRVHTDSIVGVGNLAVVKSSRRTQGNRCSRSGHIIEIDSRETRRLIAVGRNIAKG